MPVLQEKKTEDLRRLVKVLAADAYRTAHETHRAMVKQVNSSFFSGRHCADAWTASDVDSKMRGVSMWQYHANLLLAGAARHFVCVQTGVRPKISTIHTAVLCANSPSPLCQAAEAALAAAADVESQLTGRAKPEGEGGGGGEDLHRQRTAEILEQVNPLMPGLTLFPNLRAKLHPVLRPCQPCITIVGRIQLRWTLADWLQIDQGALRVAVSLAG